MAKLNVSRLCLTCDEIYDSQKYCPACTEKSFIWLRDYITPMDRPDFKWCKRKEEGDGAA
jgi:hypothetical protein